MSKRPRRGEQTLHVPDLEVGVKVSTEWCNDGHTYEGRIKKHDPAGHPEAPWLVDFNSCDHTQWSQAEAINVLPVFGTPPKTTMFPRTAKEMESPAKKPAPKKTAKQPRGGGQPAKKPARKKTREEPASMSISEFEAELKEKEAEKDSEEKGSDSDEPPPNTAPPPKKVKLEKLPAWKANYDVLREQWEARPGTVSQKFSSQDKGAFHHLDIAALNGDEGMHIDKTFHSDSPAFPWFKRHNHLRDCAPEDNVWLFNRRASTGFWAIDRIPIPTSKTGLGTYYTGKVVIYGADYRSQTFSVRTIIL